MAETKELSKEEELIRMLKDRKKIVLLARYGKTQGPLTLTPVMDPVTGQMRGVKLLSEQEKQKAIRVVDPNTNRKIVDRMTFDYDNEVDRIDWEWIVHNKEIVASRAETLKSEVALFFVDNYEQEQKEKVSLRELRLKAGNLVNKMSEVERLQVMRLFGADASYLKPFEISEFLYDKAENFPEMLIQRANDQNAKEKIFIMDAVKANAIVHDEATKVFSYGSMKIGTTLESVISWIKDPENKDLVREIDLAIKK